jgi:DnaK suppressor protein
VAVKKPVKKAAKATQKTSKPAVGKAAAKKPVVKKIAPKKAAPPKAVAKPAAKKLVTKKPAKAPGKPVASKAAVRKVPAKKAPAATRKPAPRTVSAAKPIGREAPVGPVKGHAHKQPQVSRGVATPAPKSAAPAPKSKAKPVAKPVAKEIAQQAARPSIAPRPVGKVAVAVAAKPSAPTRKDKFKMVSYKTDQSTGRPILPPAYKPSPDEEYMGPLQTEYFRQRLFSWRADLVEESKQTIENLKDEVRDVGDEAERATRETENSLELRTRDRYRKLIGKIDSTLKRLESGEYGYSVDSGEDIGLERLEARLTAERTIDEQERWEHLQKQIGD